MQRTHAGEAYEYAENKADQHRHLLGFGTVNDCLLVSGGDIFDSLVLVRLAGGGIAGQRRDDCGGARLRCIQRVTS